MNRIPRLFAICLLSIPVFLASSLLAGPDEESKEKAGKKEASAEKTREVKTKSLTLQIPESWKQQRPATSMRAAQFEIPAAKGDKDPGELVFFYFPGGAGGVKGNLERWINQFDEKGRKVKLTKGKSTQGTYYVADVTGAYNKSIGPPRLRKSKLVPGSKMLAVVLEAKDGTYKDFIKLTGPEKTITSVAKQFRASFGGNAKTEEKFKL